jgi:DNA-binding response OmpR family regulator
MPKIFIIEDEAVILAGLSAKFADRGFSVLNDDGQGDIKETWVRLNSEMPDYVVLDLVLPGFSGFDLLAKLKNDPVMAAKPVFVFTDISAADSRARCESLGVDYYFVKPDFNVDDFVKKVEKIINNLEKVKVR